jgi:predicted Zn-dependent protease
MKRSVISCLVVLICVFSSSLYGQDKILDLMRDELRSQMETLQKSDYPPYFMSYRVTESNNVSMRANLGCMVNFSGQKQRVFVPQVRIGSMDFDNFNEIQNGVPSNMQAAVLLPVDNENFEDSFKEIFREEVNSRYLFAVNALENAIAKKGVQARRSDKSPDYSPAKPEQHYDPPVTIDIDVEKWKEKLRRFSKVFADNKDLYSGTVALTYDMIRKYYVSTEGAEIVENRPYIMLSVSAETMAEDGMQLPLQQNYFAFSISELPSDATIIKDIKAMSEKLSQLKKAPLVQPYTGPAILSGSASGVFFHEIFGHRIEGQRMKSDQDGQTFKSMVGQSVLPSSLNVYDDPTMKEYGGTYLNGYYVFDEQGVRGEKVNVVDGGILKNFLMTRTPIDGFPSSNGHSRADMVNDPTSRQSNLLIETTDFKDEAELRRLLKEEAKKQGKEYGYFFKKVTGGFTQISSMAVNSFNVTPLEVYKVFVDGRKDELVRGVDLIGTPLSMFSNIICAGGSSEVFTGTCGASSGNVPVTAISPAILVNKVELQRKPQPSVTLPILPRH